MSCGRGCIFAKIWTAELGFYLAPFGKHVWSIQTGRFWCNILYESASNSFVQNLGLLDYPGVRSMARIDAMSVY